ncbi:MAG: DUF4136 domain-containing protein, partial [Candidatus Obscuribacterales bacterium]|nr:DUF4136 domain-containing protein [Steroidobacteraceae bacterium]
MSYQQIIARLCSAMALTLLLSACAARGPLVRTDYNRTIDFTSYRTFGFPPATGTDRGGYATLVTTYFKEAVQREMTARG